MKKLLQLLFVSALTLTAGGCVSTALGVAGAAGKGTAKIGAGVAKTGGKAAVAVVSRDKDKDESE